MPHRVKGSARGFALSSKPTWCEAISEKLTLASFSAPPVAHKPLVGFLINLQSDHGFNRHSTAHGRPFAVFTGIADLNFIRLLFLDQFERSFTGGYHGGVQIAQFPPDGFWDRVTVRAPAFDRVRPDIKKFCGLCLRETADRKGLFERRGQILNSRSMPPRPLPDMSPT